MLTGQRHRLHPARPGHAARRLVELPRRLDLRRRGRGLAALEVPDPLPRPAHLQPVELRPRALLPGARQQPDRAAPVLVGPDCRRGSCSCSAIDRRRRARRSSRALNLLARRGALLGHVRGRHRRAGAERSRDERELASRAGLGRLLLAGADPLARGLHLPLVHDHRPEDGARRAASPGASTPSASGCSSALLIAPQTTEFGAKVALLGSLTIVCAARPILILLGEATAARSAAGSARASRSSAAPARGAPRRDRRGRAGGGRALRGRARARRHARPAQRRGGQLGSAGAAVANVTVSAKPGVAPIDLATGRRIARDAVADLDVAAAALRSRDARRAAVGASGAWLAAAADADPRRGRRLGRRADLSRRARAHLARAGRRTGAADGRRDARGNGRALDLLGRLAGEPSGRHAVQAVVRARARGQQVRDRRPTAAARPRRPPSARAGRLVRPCSKGTAAFAGVQLTDVAAKVGLALPPGRVPLRDVRRTRRR